MMTFTNSWSQERNHFFDRRNFNVHLLQLGFLDFLKEFLKNIYIKIQGKERKKEKNLSGKGNDYWRSAR